MWSFLRRLIIPIFLGFMTLSLGYWTWAGFSQAQFDYQGLQATFPVPAIAAATATPIPVPVPIPVGPLPLTWHAATAMLLGPDGEEIFRLGEAGQWIPMISQELVASVPEGSKLLEGQDGSWFYIDPEEKILFRWDSQKWFWIRASDLPVIVQIQTPGAYAVEFTEGTQEILLKKSDPELLEIAPPVQGEAYGISHGILTPSRVFHFGENGENRQVLYFDEAQQPRLLWNVGTGALEFVEPAVYTDPESQFHVKILLVTDLAMVTEHQTRISWQDNSGPLVAQTFFDQILAVNNLYSNHLDVFQKMIRMNPRRDTNIWTPLGKLSSKQIADIQVAALIQLRQDLMALTSDQRLTLQMGLSKQVISLQPGDLWLFIRFIPGHRSYNDYTEGAFRGGGQYQITPGENAVYEIDLKYLPFKKISQYDLERFLVGGQFVEFLREITAGGAGDANYGDKIYTYSRSNTSQRSLTDTMVAQLCGESVIKTYLRNLPYLYPQKGVIPRIDRVNVDLPFCLIDEVDLGQ